MKNDYGVARAVKNGIARARQYKSISIGKSQTKKENTLLTGSGRRPTATCGGIEKMK